VLQEAGLTCTKLGSSIMTDIHFEDSVGSPRHDHDVRADAAPRIHEVDVVVVGGG
jgi:hypothetical protein